jgi:hypothetical protein
MLVSSEGANYVNDDWSLLFGCAVTVYIALVFVVVYLRAAFILLLCLRYCPTTYPMLHYYRTALVPLSWEYLI